MGSLDHGFMGSFVYRFMGSWFITSCSGSPPETPACAFDSKVKWKTPIGINLLRFFLSVLAVGRATGEARALGLDGVQVKVIITVPKAGKLSGAVGVPS